MTKPGQPGLIRPELVRPTKIAKVTNLFLDIRAHIRGWPRSRLDPLWKSRVTIKIQFQSPLEKALTVNMCTVFCFHVPGGTPWNVGPTETT